MKHKFFVLFLSLVLVFSFVTFVFADTYSYYFYPEAFLSSPIKTITVGSFSYNGSSYNSIKKTVKSNPLNNVIRFNLDVVYQASNPSTEAFLLTFSEPVSSEYSDFFEPVSFFANVSFIFSFILHIFLNTIHIILNYPVILLFVILSLALIGVGFFKRYFDF